MGQRDEYGGPAGLCTLRLIIVIVIVIIVNNESCSIYQHIQATRLGFCDHEGTYTWRGIGLYDETESYVQ